MKINFKNKKGQENKKNFILLPRGKSGQEEMLGFALIIIVVAVILLVFLGISLNKPASENVDSYEVENFIQAFLQYTTDCSDGDNLLLIQDLIFECDTGNVCSDDRETCEVLNSTLKDISEESWPIGINGETPIKGYKMEIISDENELISFKEGNITRNSKGASQDFSKSGAKIDIYFIAYY